MSYWSRAQYVEETLAVADLVAGNVGGATSVARALGGVHAAEWKGLLNANRYLRLSRRTPTLDSQSRIPLSALSSGAGDAQERLYRIVAVGMRGSLYDESRFEELPLADETPAGSSYGIGGRGSWRVEGDYLRLLPLAPGQMITAWVNHTPTPAHQLANDASSVVWPEDYELLLCHITAARLLARGGKESGAASDLLALAEEMRLDLLADMARRGTGAPLTLGAPDSAADWG